MQKARLFPTIKQKSILSAIWFVSALYGLTFCYQDKVKKTFIFTKDHNKKCTFCKINKIS